ncbi:MAG: fatty acid desaturase family protein [Candidatus Sericytochromatia bacterium]
MSKNIKNGILKYNIDIISILIVFFITFISILPIYIKLNLLSLIFIGILLLFVKPITSLIQHNHVHFDIFNSKVLNTLFDLLLSISTGHISSIWVLHHNIGHHQSEINSLEDTSSVKNYKTREYMTKMEYILSGSLKVFPECCQMAFDFYKKGKKQYLVTLILEVIVSVIVHLYLLSVNFKMAMLFLVIPNVINPCLVWLGAYWQHLNVPANSLYDSANMFEGKFFNFISFNIGYHVAHHEKPTLHWSKLKERTGQIIDKIPPNLILQRLP